jgi:hypothetical protein
MAKKKNVKIPMEGKAKKNNPLGCLGLILILLIGYAIVNGGKPKDQSSLVVVIPSQTQRESTRVRTTPDSWQTETPIPLPTDTPIAFPTNTARAISSDTPIPLPTNTPAPIRTFYVVGEYARIRDCASTDCEQVNLISSGQTLQVVEEVTGDTANGSNIWYKLSDGNFVHSSTVSQNPPVAQSSNVSTSGQAAPATGNVQPTPRTCATAKAMGLDEVQAAQHRHLDRDGDGVACYDN